jgi:hypothetical protein
MVAPDQYLPAARQEGKIRGVGEKTLRDASSRATKAFHPALSMCDLIFSGVFERHPRLTLAIVEFELASVPHLLSTMDYTCREQHGEAIYRFADAHSLGITRHLRSSSANRTKSKRRKLSLAAGARLRPKGVEI